MATIKIEKVLDRKKEYYRIPELKNEYGYTRRDQTAFCCTRMAWAFGAIPERNRGRYCLGDFEVCYAADGKLGITPHSHDFDALPIDFCPYCGGRLEYEIVRTIQVTRKRVKQRATYQEEKVEEIVEEGSYAL